MLADKDRIFLNLYGLHGADLEAAARKLAPLTCHTTIADYQLRPRYHYRPEFVNYEPRTPWVQAVPPGEGLIDYRAFLRALREGGYSGMVSVECRWRDFAAEAGPAVAFLRRTLA